VALMNVTQVGQRSPLWQLSGEQRQQKTDPTTSAAPPKDGEAFLAAQRQGFGGQGCWALSKGINGPRPVAFQKSNTQKYPIRRALLQNSRDSAIMLTEKNSHHVWTSKLNWIIKV